MEFQTLNLLLKCGKEFGHRRIRERGVSETECLLCSWIYAHPDCVQEDAARALHMDKTTAAKALAALERKGFVLRKKNPSDLRKNLLTLSEQGNARISEILHLHDQWLEKILSTLAPEEQQQFEAYCDRLLLAAEELRKQQ